MKRLWIAMAAAALVSGNCAFAQVGGVGAPVAPLGVTSPLGIGPGAAVGPTGIPFGATELGSPGLSPVISGTSPLGSTIGNLTACSGMGGSIPQSSSGMTSGTSGMTSGSCVATTDGSVSQAAASASTPGLIGSRSAAGRAGIPLGSTELGFGGLSPPPTAVIPDPSFPASATTYPSFPAVGSTLPCPVTGVPMSSGAC